MKNRVLLAWVPNYGKAVVCYRGRFLLEADSSEVVRLTPRDLIDMRGDPDITFLMADSTYPYTDLHQRVRTDHRRRQIGVAA